MSFYQVYPITGVPTYTNLAAFPPAATAGNGAVGIALDSDILYVSNGTAWEILADPAAVGTVSSVGLADTSATPIYTITNSPVTTSGTLDITLKTEVANKVFAGPTTGADAQPTFRTLVASDLPIGNLTDTGTDGIAITGGTGSVIGSGTSIAQQVADTTHNGYLSSTDWNTFNGKGVGTVTSVAASVPSVLSISGSPITGSGTLAIGYSGTALPIANGGTAVTSVTTAPTATAFAGWDANTNLSANNHIQGYATTATAAGTTVLTVGSPYLQYFTGSTTQTVTMPVTSTLVLGQQFRIVNSSSGAITLQSSGANTIIIMGANSVATLTCILTSGTTAASWSYQYAIQAAVGTVTSVGMTVPSFLSISGSPVTTSGTLAVSLSGTALPIANGGTGQTTASAAFNALSPMTTAGDIIYGGTAGAGTSLAAGTGSQILIGGTTPSWGTLPTAALPALNQYNVNIGNSSNASTATNTNLLGDVKASTQSSTVTITIATPGVISYSSHGQVTGNKFYLTTTGALPTGITASTTYYVIYVDANSFQFATTYANAIVGTAVATSGSQSGTHTLFAGGLILQDLNKSLFIQLNTGNGYGSTNTKIPRFTTTVVNTGTGIVYADSAANGNSFTCNVAGVYAFTMSFSASAGVAIWGFSLNSAQLTTNIQTITDANRIAISGLDNSGSTRTISVTLPLVVNDVVRAHSNASGTNTSNLTGIIVTRVD